MKISPENDMFWRRIGHFLTQSGVEPKKRVEALRLAADPETRSQLWEFPRAMLALDPEHDARWARVQEFLRHPDVMDWDPQFIIDQLVLIAQGKRGVELHDNCVALPLYD